MAVQNSVNITSTGLVTHDGSGNFNGRTIAGTTGGVTVANGTGVSGNPTINLDVEAQVSLNTGLITGGILSVGTPPNKFSVSDGNGVIVDCTTDPAVPTITNVAWTGETDIVVSGIAAQLITFILIDNTGSVLQQATAPTQTQRRTHIPLGVVVHVDLVNVDAVNNEQQPCINMGPQLYDLMDGLGFFNVSGNVFAPNVAANLTFDKSVGNIVKAGSNWNISAQNPHILTLASLSILTFQYRFQDGTNGATGTVIDPDIYDVAGVSTPVPNNKFTIQRIYCFISNNVKIQPGQALYSSLAEAKGSIQTETFLTEPSILANGLLRGFLCIKKGNTDLTDTSEVFFIAAGKFGGTSGTGGLSVSTLQNAYDNSSTPEIVINSTNGALSIQDAAVPIAANLLEVQSNGGGSTFFNVTVSGVDIDGALTLTTDLAVAEGGTGASTLTGVLTGNGTSAITANAVTQYGVLLGDAANAVTTTAVGTAGYVLTSGGAGVAPSYQAAGGAGGGAWTWISNVTASSDATVAFTGLDSTYDLYVVTMQYVVPVNDSVNLWARIGTGVGPTYQSGLTDYAWDNSYTGADASDSQIDLTGTVGSDTDEWGVGYQLNLYNPSLGTRFTQMNWTGGYKNIGAGSMQENNGVGQYASTTAVTAIQFLFSTGNIEVGLFSLYGVKTS